MRKDTLHEIAKFGAGLVVGDFLALLWLAFTASFPVSFLGVTFADTVIVPTLCFDIILFIVLVHYGWRIGKVPHMRSRSFLVLAGVIFSVVSVLHLIRLMTGADVVVLGWDAPEWLSWIGTIAAAYLAYMSLYLATRLKMS